LTDEPVMSKILGIIGGGQLGMMITEAAKKMPEHILKIIVLDPTENCPASQVGAEQIIADFKDEKAIRELAEKSDIITYEIESGDSDVLKSVETKAEINPSPETLKIIQDKFLQKTFLSENKIPIPEFIKVGSIEDLQQGLNKFGYPALLKARRDAYDGRGNYKIDSLEDVQKAFDYFKVQNLMLEKFIPFKMEVSVIAARNTKGQIKTYPLVENIHVNNILRETIAPARVSREIFAKAEGIAKDAMTVLKGAGVFGIEMFVTADDQILINEIAPRVHNSGHHTLQSSETSQFEQHLRAILGLELGSTKLLHPTIMYNVLGSKNFHGEYKPLEITEGNVFLKMYGKNISKPLRKLGHFNLVGNQNESIEDLLKKLDSLKEKANIFPLN
jgi:5-(carboxyamino)imidazole ribonucleotide synthase